MSLQARLWGETATYPGLHPWQEPLLRSNGLAGLTCLLAAKSKVRISMTKMFEFASGQGLGVGGLGVGGIFRLHRKLSEVVFRGVLLRWWTKTWCPFGSDEVCDVVHSHPNLFLVINTHNLVHSSNWCHIQKIMNNHISHQFTLALKDALGMLQVIFTLEWAFFSPCFLNKSSCCHIPIKHDFS